MGAGSCGECPGSLDTGLLFALGPGAPQGAGWTPQGPGGGGPDAQQALRSPAAARPTLWRTRPLTPLSALLPRVGAQRVRSWTTEPWPPRPAPAACRGSVFGSRPGLLSRLPSQPCPASVPTPPQDPGRRFRRGPQGHLRQRHSGFGSWVPGSPLPSDPRKGRLRAGDGGAEAAGGLQSHWGSPIGDDSLEQLREAMMEASAWW